MSRNSPKVFSINQSEVLAEPSDQSEVRAAPSNQSEVRAAPSGQSEGSTPHTQIMTPMSILKTKLQKIWHPYSGVLHSSKEDINQYYAYLLAYDNIMEIKDADVCPPDWLINLLNQPHNYGSLLGVMQSAVSAPKKCSHKRRVKFDMDHDQIGEYKD